MGKELSHKNIILTLAALTAIMLIVAVTICIMLNNKSNKFHDNNALHKVRLKLIDGCLLAFSQEIKSDTFSYDSFENFVKGYYPNVYQFLIENEFVMPDQINMKSEKCRAWSNTDFKQINKFAVLTGDGSISGGYSKEELALIIEGLSPEALFEQKLKFGKDIK